MRYDLQAFTTGAIVKDFTTDAVMLEISHYDEREFARVTSLPILDRFAHRGEGANVREAVIDALRLLAIRLDAMADGLEEASALED